MTTTNAHPNLKAILITIVIFAIALTACSSSEAESVDKRVGDHEIAMTAIEIGIAVEEQIVREPENDQVVAVVTDPETTLDDDPDAVLGLLASKAFDSSEDHDVANGEETATERPAADIETSVNESESSQILDDEPVDDNETSEVVVVEDPVEGKETDDPTKPDNPSAPEITVEAGADFDDTGEETILTPEDIEPTDSDEDTDPNNGGDDTSDFKEPTKDQEDSSDLEIDEPVVVEDLTPPTITGVPGAKSVEATGSYGATVSYQLPLGIDEIDGIVPVSCLPQSGRIFPVGKTAVKCQVSDIAGNLRTVAWTVTVIDTQPPEFDALNEWQSFEATGASGSEVAYKVPLATDLVSGNATVDCSVPQGSYFPLGSTVVECVARDEAGNRATIEINVRIVDSAPPRFVTDAVDLYSTAETVHGIEVHFLSGEAVDSVDGSVEVECSHVSGSMFPVGVTTVICTATDSAGNTSEIEFRVTVGAPVETDSGSDAEEATEPTIPEENPTIESPVVEADSTPPTFTSFPATISVIAVGPDGSAVVFDLPIANDDTDGNVPVNCTPQSGLIFPLGESVVTCDATDSAGNSIAGSMRVTVTASVPTSPLGIHATAKSCDVSVTWQPPAWDGGTEIKGYIVTATPSGRRLIVGAGADRVTLTGLQPAINHVFNIAAINSAGSGERTGSVSLMPICVPAAPRNVEVQDQAGDLIVTWDAPVTDGGSQITGYLIASPTAGATMNAEAGATRVAFGGLDPNVPHTVSVQALNNVGISNASVGGPVVLSEVAPTPPAVLPPILGQYLSGGPLHSFMNVMDVTRRSRCGVGGNQTLYTFIVTRIPDGILGLDPVHSRITATIVSVDNSDNVKYIGDSGNAGFLHFWGEVADGYSSGATPIPAGTIASIGFRGAPGDAIGVSLDGYCDIAYHLEFVGEPTPLPPASERVNSLREQILDSIRTSGDVDEKSDKFADYYLTDSFVDYGDRTVRHWVSTSDDWRREYCGSETLVCPEEGTVDKREARHTDGRIATNWSRWTDGEWLAVLSIANYTVEDGLRVDVAQGQWWLNDGSGTGLFDVAPLTRASVRVSGSGGSTNVGGNLVLTAEVSNNGTIDGEFGARAWIRRPDGSEWDLGSRAVSARIGSSGMVDWSFPITMEGDWSVLVNVYADPMAKPHLVPLGTTGWVSNWSASEIKVADDPIVVDDAPSPDTGPSWFRKSLAIEETDKGLVSSDQKFLSIWSPNDSSSNVGLDGYGAAGARASAFLFGESQVVETYSYSGSWVASQDCDCRVVFDVDSIWGSVRADIDNIAGLGTAGAQVMIQSRVEPVSGGPATLDIHTLFALGLPEQGVLAEAAEKLLDARLSGDVDNLIELVGYGTVGRALAMIELAKTHLNFIADVMEPDVDHRYSGSLRHAVPVKTVAGEEYRWVHQVTVYSSASTFALGGATVENVISTHLGEVYVTDEEISSYEPAVKWIGSGS